MKRLKLKYLENMTLFVTLEPCTMCASAISEVHIKNFILVLMMKKMEELKNFELLFKEKIYLCQLFMVVLWKKNVVIY